ncbi:MAG: hypothetical protein AAFN08_03720 [Cyanobacteria bacterium J06559_3]
MFDTRLVALVAISWLSLVSPVLAQTESPSMEVTEDGKPDVDVPADLPQPAGVFEQAPPPSGAPLPATGLTLPVGFPLAELHINGQRAVIPDWRVVTFSDFPRFVADGQWGETEWQAGDSLADVLTLGDVQQDLQLHLLTVEAISQKLGFRSNEMAAVSLDKFSLLKRQTLRSLVQAVPSLLDESLEDVPPIEDLVVGVNPRLVTDRLTVEAILRQLPEYGDISLGYLDLSQYTLEDLPGIEIVPFQAFASWQEATIREIPLLEYVSWWSFPKTPDLDGAIAITSVVTESGESAVHADTVNTASLQVQLDSFEDDLVPLTWAIGTTQVGGFGPGDRAQINEGQEPLGVTAFGGVFKLVPHQATPTGFQSVLYFRSCRARGESVTCSPYGIGPIPFIPYDVGSNIFLGPVTFAPQTPEPEAERPAEVASVPEEDTLIDALLPTTTAKVVAGGSVTFVLTLMMGVIVWAIKGDPIGFAQGTSQWAWAKWVQQRKRGS